MTTIPDAAVKAAIEARYDHGSEPQPYYHNRCRCGRSFATAVEHLEHATREVLQSALKVMEVLVIVDEVDRQYHFDGTEADDVWVDKP
jgi:hypothetical protein